MKQSASSSAALAVLAMTAAMAIAACQPDNPCDPGFEAKVSACVPVDAEPGDGDAAGDGGGDGDGDGDMADASMGEPGQCEAGVGSDDAFGVDCQSDADCDCPAPVCLTMGLNYCSRIQCMESGEGCPDGYNCIEIPAAFQMDGVSSVCLRQ